MQHAEKQFEWLTKPRKKDQYFHFFGESLLPFQFLIMSLFQLKQTPARARAERLICPFRFSPRQQNSTSPWNKRGAESPCASRRVNRAYGEVKVIREQIRRAFVSRLCLLSHLPSVSGGWSGVGWSGVGGEGAGGVLMPPALRNAGYNWLRG